MKPNLILLHGALGCADELATLKAILSEQFNIHSFDFDGHGTNTSNLDFSIDLFSENLNCFIEEHDLAPCHVFGYSMGGYVALKLASTDPEKIGKIVTLGTKFDWTPETGRW